MKILNRGLAFALTASIAFGVALATPITTTATNWVDLDLDIAIIQHLERTGQLPAPAQPATPPAPVAPPVAPPAPPAEAAPVMPPSQVPPQTAPQAPPAPPATFTPIPPSQVPPQTAAQAQATPPAVATPAAPPVVAGALTVAEATDRAIRNDSDIANREGSELALDEDVRRAREDVFNAVTNTQITNANVALMNAELQRSLNIRDTQIRRENVEFNITRSFNTILNHQADLEISRANLDMATRELAIAELRLSLGMASDLDVQTAALAVTRAETNIEILQGNINRAFRDLNNTMGAGATGLNQHHTLVLELTYEPVVVTNINAHIQRFMDESTDIARAEGQARAAGYRAEHYITPHDPMTGIVITGSGPGMTTYDEFRETQSQHLRTAADVRQNVRESVVRQYNDLLNMEINIRATELELEQLVRQLGVSESSLALGRTTQIEVDRLRLQIAEMENSLQQAKNNHSIQRIAFNNPRIIMPGAQAQQR